MVYVDIFGAKRIDMERLTLAIERIKQIKSENVTIYNEYFCNLADFILELTKLKDKELDDLILEELKNLQSLLYKGIESD